MPPSDIMSIGPPDGPSTPAPYQLSKSRAPRTLPVQDVSPCGSTGSSSSGSGASATTASTMSDEEPRTPNLALAGLAIDTPEGLDDGLHVSGKRPREEWAKDEVMALETALARPPPHMAFAPGSLPPPHVLDELASAVMDSYAKDDESFVSDQWSAESSRSTSPTPSWPHTWEETRRKLVSLALAETRLGAELAERKMTRQERLTRPGMKRYNSMDYLDEADAVEALSIDNAGRVLRVSTTLQNSANGPAPAPVAARDRSASLSVPIPGVGKRLGTPPPNERHLPYRPPPMRRCSSGRSDYSTSRRPSLLARGRSFTASDLEAEADAAAAAEAAQEANGDRDSEERTGSDTDTDGDDNESTPTSYFDAHPAKSQSLAIPEVSPTNTRNGFFDSLAVTTPEAGETELAVPAASESPAVTVSAPALSPPSKRSATGAERWSLGRSKSYTTTSRPHAQRDSFLEGPGFTPILGLTMTDSPPSHASSLGGALGSGLTLDSAFDPTGRAADTSMGWESDSDRETAVQIKKKRLGSLAMTAMKTAARSSSGSVSGSSSGSATPPLVISSMVDDAALARDGGLSSPFEEKHMELK